MFEIIMLYIAFFKIGAVSFGGGYAMLPFIEKEVIENLKYLNSNEFLDILAISQITPGPIAINSATFIGFRKFGIVGSIVGTLGIVSAPFIFMNITNVFLKKFKESNFLEKILLYIRPVTVALILSAFLSTLNKSVIDIKSAIIFLVSFLILYTKKKHPILVIFLFGFIGIIMSHIGI